MQTLRLFCEVATCRSFSEAAARYGVTQSAASQRIGQLEKRLGVTLIDRSVRPLRPTPAGALFLDECRHILERYDRLEKRVQGLEIEPAGDLIVDAIYSAGIDLLNDVREDVESRYPRVRVTLDYKRPDAVVDAVREQRCELGIVSYPSQWRGVGMTRLWREPMGVICSPKHELAGEGTIDVSHLARWRLATFEPTLPVGRAVRRYLREHGVKPNVENVFDNIDTIKSAVAVTDEIAIVPRRTVRREVEAGSLALIELTPGLYRPMGLIYRARKGGGRSRGNGGPVQPFGAAAQVFVDSLLAYDGPDVEREAVHPATPSPPDDVKQDDSTLVGDHA